MQWGPDAMGSQEKHYKQGRTIQEVKIEDVEAACQCGYIILAPKGTFEQRNGGQAVKRSLVKIVRPDGSVVKRLRGVQRYHSCNACVNNWK
jgi:hypothetical protein